MEINFPKPPPAVTFSPTIEEFSDPLTYIQRIYPVARDYGICKIRPPEGWRPPFCADPFLFSFTPRLQHLAEISAYNRSKNDFITSVINFWEAQDVTIFAPYIKRKKLDLYALWKTVQANGGYQSVCDQKLWTSVSKSLGFDDIPQYASAISTKYKKILLPYDLFINSQETIKENSSTVHQLNQKVSSPGKRKPSAKKILCRICGQGENNACLLVCHDCETLGACHTYCLNPPLSDVPKGSWFCPQCVCKRFNRLQVNAPFGFMPSKKPKTLSKFSAFADQFKFNHFRKPAHLISIDEVENEFWRLLDDEETNTVVEYGADLNARDYGSGFPMKQEKLNGAGKAYVDSPWNLNNIPLSEKSALRFIPKDISGMIIPWCYVGMVFSCFCWHTEDHWSYSINYLHTGSPKIWYGVPTAAADAFEAAMRAEVPELFRTSPDLLHHMTTMIPPEKLRPYGVPIYRLEQMAGEFVITFPRAYHAGFNQGFNFAEAVNFCPADWFALGQHSIEYYALHHRAPVFSHAELLCRMAASTEPLSVDFLCVVSNQLEDLLTTERNLRRRLALLGVRRTERLVFEDTEDEKRECDLCRTTLYLSALTCKCAPTMLCLAHHQARTCCPPEEQVMRYRYGLDELSESINKLKTQLDEYRLWERRVAQCVTTTAIVTTAPVTTSPNGDTEQPTSDSLKQSEDIPVPPTEVIEDKQTTESSEIPNDVHTVASDLIPASVHCKPENDWKPTLTELKDLVATGKARNYPSEMLDKLKKLIHTVGECTSVIESIVSNYHNACDFSQKQPTNPAQKRSSSMERRQRRSQDTSSSSDEETSAAEIDKDNDEMKEDGTEEKAQSDAESDGIASSSSADYENGMNYVSVDREFDCKSVLSVFREASPAAVCKADPGISYKTIASGRTSSKSPRTSSSPRLKSERLDNDAGTSLGLLSPTKTKCPSGPVISKLSLNEFYGIMQVAREIQPYLSNWQELEQVASHLQSWGKRANELLNSLKAPVQTAPLREELASVEELDKLLRFANAINVELSETKELQMLRDWLVWIQSVETILATTDRTDSTQIPSAADKLSLDQLYLLQIQGSALSAVVTYSSFRATQHNGPLDRDDWDEGPIPESKIERALHHASARLLRVIYSAKQTEAKLLAITKAKPYSLTLDYVLREVQQLDTLPVSLPLAQKIIQMCKDSEEIAQQIEVIGKLLVSTPFGKRNAVLDPHTFPETLYDQLGFGTLDCTSAGWKTCVDELMEKVQDSPLQLPYIDRVRPLLNFVDECRTRLIQLFIWPHSKLSLLELLLPRSSTSLNSLLNLDATSSDPGTLELELGRGSGSRRHARTPVISASVYALFCKENAREFAKALVNWKDAGLLYDTIYCRYIEVERGLMQRLRGSNMAKSRAKQQDTVVYCVCRKPGFAGFMLQCELCRDWFHGKCVYLPNLKDAETERLRYMCPRCERSLRPDLNLVLSVLDDLIQALPVERSEGDSADAPCMKASSSTNRLMCLLRLPEFVAVQLLCERAFLFIRHLQETILSTPELHRAITEYEQFSGVKMPLDTYTEETGPSMDFVHLDPTDSSHPPKVELRPEIASGTTRMLSGMHGQYEKSNKTVDRPREARTSKKLEEEAMMAARELNDLPNDSGHHAQDTNVMSLMMMRKQTRKAPLVARGTVSNRLDSGQETEAAEALAGMSASFRDRVPTTERPHLCSPHSESEPRASGTASSLDRRSFGSSRLGTKLMRASSGRSGSVAYMPVRRDTSSSSELTNAVTRWNEVKGDMSAKIRPPSRSQFSHSAPNPVTKFRFVLSNEARHILESLIMEACLLEINVPQTRWLWQLHLATDPEVDVGGGAYPLAVARAEEEKLKRRFIRHLKRVKCGGKRRRRPRQQSSSTTEAPSDSEKEIAASATREEQRIRDNESPSRSDTASSTPRSIRSTSDKNSYGHTESRRPLSSSRLAELTRSRSRPSTHPLRENSLKRKPYRPRATATVGSVARRHELAQAKRLQPSLKRRSLARPIVSSTAGSRFGVHCPSARYMNLKLYRQRLAAMNRNAGAIEARIRYSRFSGTEGLVRPRRPRRGTALERFAAADRVIYRTPDALYTSDSEGSSTAPDEAHYHASSESNQMEQHGRSTTGLLRRRRIGRSAGLGSRLTRRLPRDRRELHELLNRGRGRKKLGSWSIPEATAMETDSDSGSTIPDRNDECAAHPCENPRTGTVRWIACDDCCNWFHQLCVGIRHKSQVPEVYICPRCSRRSGQHSRHTSLHQERAQAHRMRNLTTVTTATTNAPTTSTSNYPGTSGMGAAPPMRMREFHYSDGARMRASHLPYMAVQRPIGWNASNLLGTGPGFSRPSADLLYPMPRTRTATPHQHSTAPNGLAQFEHATERPVASAVADQWVADYPHSPGTDELDSTITNPIQTTLELPHDEGGRRSPSLQSATLPLASQQSISDPISESAPATQSSEVQISEQSAMQMPSKDPTEVLLEAIDVISGAVESACSPGTST